MRTFGGRVGIGAHSGKAAVALIVLVKLTLLVGAVVLLGLGAWRSAGGWIVAAHVAVLTVVGPFFVRTFLAGSGARHRAHIDAKVQRAAGITLHDAAGYDRLVGLLTLGREGKLRELMLRPAALRPGEAVLDVACGTGTLALAAKRLVGPTGSVTGLDASADMIERARAKALKAGLDLDCARGLAQELPFEDGRFDVVMGTLMLHHLPKPARAAFAREARRVLRPGGRLLAVDFGRPVRRSRLPRLHRHGHVDLQAFGKTLAESGFEVVGTGEIGMKNLHYVLARSADANRPKAVGRRNQNAEIRNDAPLSC